MAAAPAKFMFDLDLGRHQEKNRVLSETAIATIEADARQVGFSEGVAAGEKSANAQSARKLAAAATTLGDRIAAMTAAMDDTRRTTLAEAVDLAATIARKLAAGLLANEPVGEIETLITECLASIGSAPHLVIRCNDELADAVRDTASSRMQASGFAGRLVVMGDPDIAVGDCRLEWADGGLVRDQAALTAQIDDRIAAYLAARGKRNGTPSTEETN